MTPAEQAALAAANPLTWQAVATLVAAGIAALAALASVALNIWALHSKSHRDSLAAIANHRVRWMEHTRELVVDFIDAAFVYSDARRKGDIEKSKAAKDQLFKVNSAVMINTLRAENIDFLNALNVLLTAAGGDDSPKLIDASAKFRDEAGTMLKREWEKVKLELKGREK